MNKEVILAIETGIAGGSLSLLRNGSEIDFWKGVDKISRSEDLLLNISSLLSKNSLDKNEIKKIAVSCGPGSFTGVRVGIATAKGLQSALKCECCGVSLLESMVLKTKNAGQVITAFAVGKNEVCWQSFETDGYKKIQSRDFSKINLIDDFAMYLKKRRNVECIFESALFNKIPEFESELDFSSIKLTELKENPSKYIGLRSEQIPSTAEILPVYARESRVK
jgi:tRNA threonylcarbamoyl adenosine modification protein YeaZ